ncbi:MAG TPA: tetratricopeptide repeat protein [Terriglobales bacterium]|jgi:tetratricopeptide (TPR) repeat protein|nr:tetratricopeptide repeat protein [Terriglobales bacterium]
MKTFAGILLTLLFCAVLSFANEGQHHEELTQEQLGTVHFPVSCSALSQKPFERGVALLHSFWYEQAEATFEKIAKDDPRCAMAHWGIAMSLWHQLWNHPDEATIKRGLTEAKMANAFHPATDRERDYIAAINDFNSGSSNRKYQARATSYSKAMQKVYQRNPDDHEAAAFYALSLLASEPEHDTGEKNRRKAAAVLEKVFAVEPNHPGVIHYLIHTYDTTDMAALGLPAARRYAQIAPAAPHALHMPSHIFARLGLWQDDINSNLASIAASRKYAEMGGEGHEFHAMDFLFYAYMQSGREADAHRLMEEVKAMPPMKDMYGMGYDPRISALVAFEAMYPLELHHWQEAAELPLVPGASPEDDSITHWARAIGLAHVAKAEDAQKEVKEIETIHKKLSEDKKSKSALDAVDQNRKEAEPWAEYAKGKSADAISLLRSVEETGVFEASAQLPARGMLADLLLAMNRPAEALAEYETDLKTNPNRFNSLYGAARAAERAGNKEKASGYYAQLVKNCDGSVSMRPELSEAKEWLAAQQNVSAKMKRSNGIAVGVELQSGVMNIPLCKRCSAPRSSPTQIQHRVLAGELVAVPSSEL